MKKPLSNLGIVIFEVLPVVFKDASFEDNPVYTGQQFSETNL